MKRHFDDWPNDALRRLVSLLGEELNEISALADHHESRDAHPMDQECVRVDGLKTYLRRLHWAAIQTVEKREEPET